MSAGEAVSSSHITSHLRHVILILVLGLWWRGPHFPTAFYVQVLTVHVSLAGQRLWADILRLLEDPLPLLGSASFHCAVHLHFSSDE